MEKLINYHFAAIILTLILGCNQEEFKGECGENICKNYHVTKHYNNETGIIREIVIGDNQPDGSYIFYFHNQYTKDRPYKLHVIVTDTNDLLVPCKPLSKDFMSDSLAVNFSGNKTDCCNVLTHTNWRTSFGCMIDITSVEAIKEN